MITSINQERGIHSDSVRIEITLLHKEQEALARDGGHNACLVALVGEALKLYAVQREMR